MAEACNAAVPGGKLTKMKHRHVLRNALAKLLEVDETDASNDRPAAATAAAPTLLVEDEGTAVDERKEEEDDIVDFDDLSFLLTEMEKMSIRRRKSKTPGKMAAGKAVSAPPVHSAPPPLQPTPEPAAATTPEDTDQPSRQNSEADAPREAASAEPPVTRQGSNAAGASGAAALDIAASPKRNGIKTAGSAKATGGASWVVLPARTAKKPPGNRKTSAKSLAEMKQDLLQSKSALDSAAGKGQPSLKRGQTEHR